MTLKAATLATVLIAGATSLAMAQNGPVTGTGPRATPPASYKGPGGMPNYAAAQYRGDGALYNQAPSAGMPPKSYKGPGGMPSYAAAQPAAIDNKASSGGNDSNGMPPKSYKGPGGMPSYK
jgi:hypothetical protein